MAVSDAATVLSEHWPQLLAELGDADARLLRQHVDMLNAAATDKQRSRIWLTIIELATTRLGRSSALRTLLDQALAVPRFTTGTAGWTTPPIPVTSLKPSVETWVLEAPAVSAMVVRRRGGDPDLPGLIRIRRSDGRVSLPTFQFTRAGEPKPLVLRINQLLGADTDPWGVADWWLCPNVWLAGTPVDLLDTLDDHVLVAAAAAALEG